MQEPTVRSFVANDTLLVGGRDEDEEASEGTTQRDVPGGSARTARTATTRASGPSMLIMTGPNYSGKSVYLKQVSFNGLHVLSLEIKPADMHLGGSRCVPGPRRQVSRALPMPSNKTMLNAAASCPQTKLESD